VHAERVRLRLIQLSRRDRGLAQLRELVQQALSRDLSFSGDVAM
jgi:hypothetical protein